MIYQLCVCDDCRHGWMGKELPERCPKCHKRTWNGKGITGSTAFSVPEVLAEIADSDEALKKVTGKTDYCRHGLYAANCRACRQ